ncbi:50S ribosomal protein L24 [bacterium]|jgi:large subunit ribosomal protein L24|nr:50S ribosomal protein L24 [bacterium]
MKRVIKGDKVVVLTGRDKGKKGEIIEVLLKKGKVKVKGVNFVSKHMKARKQGDTPGIKKFEAFIDISNVMPIDKETGNFVRVNKIKRS